MKALIFVDIQNDFLPGGALAVSNGDAVVPVANHLMPYYELVIATQDWHPANHQSFASQHPGNRVGDVIDLEGIQQILWPDHCVQETHGADLASDLHCWGINQIIRKGTDPLIDGYSGFFDNQRRKATGLEEYLRDHNVDSVDVMGLATDYCVKFTALDATDIGFQTSFLRRGSRAVELNPGDGNRAIERMRKAGVKIIED